MWKFSPASAAVLGATALLVASSSVAGAVTLAPTPPQTVVTVNAGAGDQTDPHVSGQWAVYTDFSTGQVRYHDLVGGTDAPIPKPDGAADLLSDVSGAQVVFVRRTASENHVFRFDMAAPANPPIELDPQPTANRRETAVGGSTVAWQDFGLTASVVPEIVVYDLTTDTPTRLTADGLYDRDPAVSPGGNVVVWSKCTSVAGNCGVWQAVRTGGTWTSAPLTSGDAENELPDTNGDIVVYTRAGDVRWQPVGGGPEQTLSLPDVQTNPNVSGSVITFESYQGGDPTPNFDVYAYDYLTDQLYRVTTTPVDESLSDVWVSPSRLVRIVFSRRSIAGNDDVYATSFQLPALETTPPTCALTKTVTTPPKRQEVTVQDTGPGATGLAAITNVHVTNGTVTIQPFTAGTTAPVVVTATKDNPNLPTSWSFDAVDRAGNVRHCA